VLDDVQNFCEKLSQNRRIYRELNNLALAELPSKLMRQTLVLTCSFRVESLHTLIAVTFGLLHSQMAIVTPNSIRKERDVVERRCNALHEN